MILNDYVSPVNSLMKKLRMLPIDLLLRYHTAVQVYKCINAMSPSYLCNMFVISGAMHGYGLRDAGIGVRPPLPHLEISKRSFRYAGAHVWNALPLYIRKSASLSIFKGCLKQYLLDTF